MEKNSFANWCIERHKITNHYYDTYLPYEFHLRMVVKVAEDFKAALSLTSVADYQHVNNIMDACWGHDLIEDTRTSYNDILKRSNDTVADIIFACTNLRGKNRKERACDAYYYLIRNTPGAVFVKLCDRIANVQYSKMSGSKMFDMYKSENTNFINQIGEEYPEMLTYLNNLFI